MFVRVLKYASNTSISLRTALTKLNRFQVNVIFLYPLKTSENLWISDVFRGHEHRTLALNGLNSSSLWAGLQVQNGCAHSSNVIEVIRPISTFLFFFMKKFYIQKKHKKQTNHFHSDISIRLKSIKSKQASSTQIFLHA